jgi:hypothetical protein
MNPISDQILPDISEGTARVTDEILSVAERGKRYRAKLIEHSKGKRLRLKQLLLGKRRYFRSLDVIPRRKRAEDTDIMCRYFNGDQYGSYDEMGIYQDNRHGLKRRGLQNRPPYRTRVCYILCRH